MFKIISDLEISNVSISLGSYSLSENGLLRVVDDTPSLSYSALLSEAPAGLFINAKLNGPKDQIIDQQPFETKNEGKQNISFFWKQKKWAKGKYLIQLFEKSNVLMENSFIIE